MKEKARDIRYFLFSQYLSDGIRITIEIVLPALVCAHFGQLDSGLLLSTGALCVSMGDAPGPLEHKYNGMLYCNIVIFVMALLTGFANHNIILLGTLLLFASFFFTMFAVFGLRASSVGIAALLIMILRMDKIAPPPEVLTDALLILAGGVWYMLLALLFFMVRPFRQAQRSLGNCIHETSKLLLIKAALYDPSTNITDEYRKLLDQQVIVNERQDEVRQLLFRGKEIVKDTTRTGQVLLITFTDLIDLYEQATATWYDYDMLRVKFSATGILPEIAQIIKNIAFELDSIGLAIQSNVPYKKNYELMPALTILKGNIDAAKIENASNLVLKKVLINLRNLGERVAAIANYFTTDIDFKSRRGNRIDYSKFVSHQEISVAIFRDNLVLDAAVFRHALRMTITCVLGFMVAKFISNGHHSYWILLTIVFIMKPGYSITKERNIQRIAGTIGGGLIGIALLATIQNRLVLLALIIFFMIGTYTWQRLNYIVTVIFMTPYILILFSFLGLGFINIVEERVLDTAIASVLAFFASYFLFPHWESKQLDTYMASVLKANIDYLQRLKTMFAGAENTPQEYKLIRKELYVSTANLSAAFSRMLSEPRKKQQKPALINEFVVLNNVLSSNIASLFAVNTGNEQQAVSKEIIHILNRSVSILEESLHLMEGQPSGAVSESSVMLPPAGKTGDQQIREHAGFIFKISADIKKAVQKING